jgi:hypothetical protein
LGVSTEHSLLSSVQIYLTFLNLFKMKKLGIVQLEKLQAGMSCSRLGQVLEYLYENGHGDQADSIRDMMGAGYTLCD